MKSLILLSLLVCVLASPLIPQLDKPVVRKSPRSASIFPCESLVCASAGSQCTTNGTSPCDVCSTNYFTCLFAPGINATGECACYSSYVSCSNGLGAYCSFTSYFAQQQCLTSGLSCCGTPITSVQFPSCQSPNTFCSSHSGLCESVHKTGPCSSNNECGDPSITVTTIRGEGYVCSAGNCAYLPDLPPGVSCSANTDCASGICTSGACSGVSVGASCNDNNACVKGAYCDGTCKTVIPVGGDCSSVSTDAQTNACVFESTCNGTCIKWSSRTSGQSCSDSSECTTNVCFQGVCTTAPPAKSCTNDSDCSGDSRYTGTCSCIGSKYQCASSIIDVVSPCQTQYNDILNCISSASCDVRGIGYNCCNNEYNCYTNCALNSLDQQFEGVAFTCGTLPTCHSKSAGMTLQAGLFFTLVLLLASLML